MNNMENKENINIKLLQEDLTFDAKITIQNRLSKDNKIYQIMSIGVINKLTGELLEIHQVYIKESLRQIIEFIITLNN